LELRSRDFGWDEEEFTNLGDYSNRRAKTKAQGARITKLKTKERNFERGLTKQTLQLLQWPIVDPSPKLQVFFFAFGGKSELSNEQYFGWWGLDHLK